MSNRSSIVYAVERRPDKDLTPASKFGEIVYLVEIRKGDRKLTPQIELGMWDKLKDFRDEDYLLLVGDPVLIGTATALASEANKGRVQFLKWDRESKTYKVERMGD